MSTLLLTTHIVAMSASLFLMGGAVVQALRGRKSAIRLATSGMVATTIGAVTGAIMLLFAPLMLQCALLTVYLIATTLLYTYGFGSGFADNARLIRHRG